MPGINFLADKKNKSKKSGSNNKKRKIEWTKPVEDKSLSVSVSKVLKNNPVPAKKSEDKSVIFGDSEKKFGKFNFFGWLSFLKKDNNIKPDRAALARRQEALRPVNNREEKIPVVSPINKQEKKQSRGFLFWKKKYAPAEKNLEKAAKKSDKKEVSIKNNKKEPVAVFSKTAEQENEKKWEKTDVLETNLIKGELASFFNWKKGILILGIYSLFSGLIIAGFYGGLVLWERQIKESGAEYSNRIRDLNEQVIKPLEKNAKKILSEQENVKLAGDILRKHIYWTNFFKFLEDNTLSEVYYTSSFSGDTKGKYSFPARTKNFKTILDQVDVMRMNDNVIKATVNGGSVKMAAKSGQADEAAKGAVGGVDFKLELMVKPDIFMK